MDYAKILDASIENIQNNLKNKILKQENNKWVIT
jgi:hypothetical protein